MAKMIVEFKHGFGDIVYLKTDPDQHPRQVIKVSAAPKESEEYELAYGDGASWHFELEISKEKNVLLTSTN